MPVNDKPLKRVVCPQDNLLVDKCGEIDHLGYSIYSQTLSNILSKSSTPVTVGLFSPFGSGKSFLLRQIRYYLKQIERQQNDDDKTAESKTTNDNNNNEQQRRKRACYCPLIFVAFVLLLLSALAALAFQPNSEAQIWRLIHHSNATSNSTTTVAYPRSAELKQIRTIVVFLFAAMVVAIFFLFICSCACRVGCVGVTWRTCRILSFVAFTRMPAPESCSSTTPLNGAYNDPQEVAMELGRAEPKRERYRRRFIMVNFSAWEYAGSDILWAAIITNIIQQVEQEIGEVTTRLFRVLSLELADMKATKHIPTTCVLIRHPRDDVTTDDVMRAVTKYGTVTSCHPCSEGWKVEFDSPQSAGLCLRELKFSGVDISRCAAPSSGHQSSAGRSRDTNDLEMTNMATSSDGVDGRLVDYPQSQDGVLREGERWKEGMKFFNHLYDHPKLVFGGIPLIFVFCLFIIALLLFPFAISMLVSHLQLDIIRIGRAVPVTVQVLSWLPAIVAVLVVIARFTVAMLHSQVARLNSALSGASGNYAKELGFMFKVKTEVEILERLLQTVKSIQGTEYKVVISIDDLDRCASDKIRSVLEAVHILLSDRNSPFVCLMAVDATIAAASFDSLASGKNPIQQPVAEYPRQYLDKIINIPFYLPKLNETDKQRYLSGLLDEVDICYYDVTLHHQHNNGGDVDEPSSSSRAPPGDTQDVTDLMPTIEIVNHIGGGDHGGHENPAGDTTDGDAMMIHGGDIETDSIPVDHPTLQLPREIFFKCREYLVKDELVGKYSSSNLRSMKRLFNILLIASHLICAFHQFVLQKRTDDTLNYTRNFVDYERGFGDVSGEHWLGLRQMNLLTESESNHWVVRFDLEDFDNETRWEEYSEFRISAGSDYTLTFDEKSYNGTAGVINGWSLTSHNGAPFSARDSDQDEWDTVAADHYGGGWWYRGDYSVLTTGMPYGERWSIQWGGWKTFDFALKSAIIKIKRA